MLYVHNQFARGTQIPKWSDASVVAFERQDKRENTSMTDADGTVLLFMMNSNGAAGQNRASPPPSRPAPIFGSTPAARRMPAMR